MTINTNIKSILASNQATVNFEQISGVGSLSEYTEVGGNCLVSAVLLTDGKTLYQVLFPADYLVDIQEISQFVGAKLAGVLGTQRQDIMSKEGLTHIPAIPGWNGYRVIIDSKLITFSTLLLQSGNSDSLLSVDRDDFYQLVHQDDVCDFARSIEAIAPDPSQDESDIKESLNRFTGLRIKQRLDETLELPPLPRTAQKIIELRANPNADINDLAELVEQDPSLAAQVVSWASSPYYSAPGKIKSIHDAIMRVLGFDMVLNLSLGIALGKTLECKDITSTQLKGYWLQAVYTAAAMEALVKCIDKGKRPEFGMAYLSGLLHNFGFFIVADVFPPYFEKTIRYKEANTHLDAMQVERHLLGSAGNQIAAWLLDSWNMPKDVVRAIRHQYDVHYDGQSADYANLLYVSQHLLAQSGFGVSSPKPVSDDLFELLNLDKDKARAAIDELLESSDELNEIAKKLS